MNKEDIVYRLRKRSEIRKQIKTRKSVQDGQPDRLCELLEEAANKIIELKHETNTISIDVEKVALMMVDTYGYNPKSDDFEGYTYALVDALEKLYTLETAVTKQLKEGIQITTLKK